MQIKFMRQAIQIAKQNPGFGNARIGAVLVCKNKVVTTADNNNRKSHPIMQEYGRNADAIYPHAEIALLLNAERLGFETWHKATIYIARIATFHNIELPANVKPCEGCFKAIRYYGVEKVFWTFSEDTFGFWQR